MKFSTLVASLAADLETNGDAEHVAIGVVATDENGIPHRLDAVLTEGEGGVEIFRDHNYVQGMVCIAADYQGSLKVAAKHAGQEACTDTVEVFQGNLWHEDLQITIEFEAPVGATVAEKDSAFMVALAQTAQINYLSVGQSDAPRAQSMPQHSEASANEGLVVKAQGNERATRFMQELLDSVESLTGVAEMHGARTLADLMFLQQAILNGGFIDHYPAESMVLEIARGLPSGDLWATFITVEYLTGNAPCAVCNWEEASPATTGTSENL